jgi:hypothetical protein
MRQLETRRRQHEQQRQPVLARAGKPDRKGQWLLVLAREETQEMRRLLQVQQRLQLLV